VTIPPEQIAQVELDYLARCRYPCPVKVQRLVSWDTWGIHTPRTGQVSGWHWREQRGGGNATSGDESGVSDTGKQVEEGRTTGLGDPDCLVVIIVIRVVVIIVIEKLRKVNIV
jgi:hypothetical protein